MKRNRMSYALPLAALTGMAALLAQPANAQNQRLEGIGFEFSLHPRGGGRLLLACNPGDNKIYLEAFSNNGLDSAAEMALTGRNASPVPRLSLAADTTYIHGNVGIGVYLPTYKLDVAGAVRATGGFTITSDARYKTHIATYDNGLDTILKLRGVTFEWDKAAFKEMHFSAGKQVGFIAQEVEKVLPDLVSTDEKGYKSVAYTNIVPVLVEAVKEQQKQIDELKKQNVELAEVKALVNTLTARLTQMEAEKAIRK